VDWADLVPLLAPAGTSTLPLGVGGDEAGPVVLDPDRDGRQVLVVGPPRSGRSTLLRSLAAGLCRVGWPFAVVTARRGPLDDLGDLPVVACAPEDSGALLEARRAFPSLAVLVDDADLLNDTPIDVLLREVTRRVEHDRGLLACAASTSALALQFRGVAVEVGRARTGILLSPAQPSDGEVFGLRRARVSERVPGRGLWVSGGDAVELQLACPPPTRSPAQSASHSLLGAP
jgi:S-DNA-T family DNA segregation ATPase FtsK/SpoIIIE